MNYLKSVVSNFIKQEDGPTAVEYAVMLALFNERALLLLHASSVENSALVEGKFFTSKNLLTLSLIRQTAKYHLASSVSWLRVFLFCGSDRVLGSSC